MNRIKLYEPSLQNNENPSKYTLFFKVSKNVK